MAAKDTDEEIPQSELRKRSYPIDLPLYRLEKRAKEKTAKACKTVDLASFRYPSAGEWGGVRSFTPKRYGFNNRDSCENYEWDSPDTNPEVKYETEHVLEWQIVAGFFTKMGEEIDKEFEHPDPEKKDGKKTNFCEYWKESWAFTSIQVMDDPDPAAATAPTVIGPDGTTIMAPEAQKRKSFEWLASQYPYKDQKKGGGEMWLEELTLLEKKLNGDNKMLVCIILFIYSSKRH